MSLTNFFGFLFSFVGAICGVLLASMGGFSLPVILSVGVLGLVIGHALGLPAAYVTIALSYFINTRRSGGHRS